MRKKVASLIKKTNKTFLLLILLDIALLPIIYFFWVNNNLLNWDFPGHIAQINYYKDHLLPFLSGWNPEYSLGYPQGDFYPPVFHYLIALLCLIYNNPFFWIKLLFSLTLLALPWTIFYFLKSFAINVIKKPVSSEDIFIGTAITLLVIILGPVLYGGTLKSFSIVGLLNNFLALPLFFVFLGSILSYRVEKDWKYIIRNTILVSLIMLSHLVVGLVSVLIMLSMFVFLIIGPIRIKEINFRKLPQFISSILNNNLFQILLLSFLATAFFYIPMIAYQDYVNSQIMVPPDRRTVFGLVFIAIALTIIYFNAGKILLNRRLFLGIVIPMFVFIAYCLIEVIMLSFGKRLLIGLVQSYRLLAFAMFILPGITTLLLLIPAKKLSFPKKNLVKKYFKYLLLLLPLALLVTSFLQNDSVKSYIPRVKYNEAEIRNRTDGNFLSIVLVDQEKTYIRSEVYAPIVTGQNTRFVNVLFAESSYLEVLVTSLTSTIDENNGAANKPSIPMYPDTYKLSFEEVHNILTLLDVEYLLYTPDTKFKYDLCSDDKFLYSELDLIEKEKKTLPIYGCRIKKEIFVPCFETALAPSNWDKAHYEASFDEKALVYTRPEARSCGYPYLGEIDWWKDGQQFSFIKKRPGLAILPVQYNPRWRAYEYDRNGNVMPVKVYRVTPNLIGVENRGKIYFEYEIPLAEKILGTLSAITWIALVVGGVWVILRRK